MSIKANDELGALHEALGAGGEVQVVPIFVPIQTFKLLLQAGQEHGLSVSDLIARSIELFLQPKQDINTNKEETKQVRTPDVVMKRRRP
jgi:hypothetical protein